MTILFLEKRDSVSRLLNLEKIESKLSIEFDGTRKYVFGCIQSSNYSLVVFSDWTNQISHSLIFKLKLSGVKVAYLFDGVYDWHNTFYNRKHYKIELHPLHPLKADYCFYVSLGNFSTAIMNQHLETRFIKYMPMRNLSTMDNEIRKRKDRYRYLITTANTSYFDEEEYLSLVKVLSYVIPKLKEYNIDVIFRVFDTRLSRDLNLDPAVNYVQGDFSSILSSVDCLISTNSTVCVEAAMLNIPVAYVCYRDFISFSTPGWIVCDNTRIEKLIIDMTNFGSVDHDRKLLFQKSALVTSQDELMIEFEKIEREKGKATRLGYFSSIVSHVLNRIKIKYDNESK
ncbi:hypothetical protein [Vibrio splendidus]|uniref:hypothetical protein n=1 Tax=Vibrio splendidus TaxID=29497 RepID=UPI0007F97DA9|nr:hypothetical protein [Vibrio splendidus]OBT24228.1 hypothetical protein A9262_19660 [Vibrio splendidus]